MSPVWKETLDLDTEKAELLNDLFPLVFTNKYSRHTGWVTEGKDRDWENEELCTVGEDQVQVHLSNLKVQRSMESDEIRLQVLREVVDEVAEKSQQSSEVPNDCKGET